MRSLTHMIRPCPEWRAAALALFLLGCGGDHIVPFQPKTGDDAARLYWALTLDEHAVTMSTASPYDTVRVVATPRDADGNPISGLGPIIYTSSDPERAYVDSAGIIHARKSGSGILIKAQLTVGNTKHLDQLTLRITDVPAPPTSVHLSIQPVPPDSARWAVFGDVSFIFLISANGSTQFYDWHPVTPRVTDSVGTPIPGVLVTYSSSDTTVGRIVVISSAMLQGVSPGRMMLTASALYYGAHLADSAEYTITMPVRGVVKVLQREVTVGGATQLAFEPLDVTVSPGGTVIWANVSGQSTDLVFDNPTNVVEHGVPSCAKALAVDPGGSGDIEAFGEPQAPDAPTLLSANCRSRRFLAAGTYSYHSTSTGATGRVIVTDGLTSP